MKLTFFGSVLGYHQEGLAKAFYNSLGDDYHYVVLGDLPDYRKEAGFENLADKYPFVVKAYTPEGKETVEDLISTSDVAIVGAANNEIIRKCVENGIETYLFSERFFKKGIWRAYVPSIRKKVINRAAGYKQPNFKVLCASAYLPYDLSLCGWHGDAYQWGYFPDIEEYDIDELLSKKATGDEPIEILWAARFLKLKHPEKTIQVAKYLKQKNIPFHMSIIGYGELEDFVKNEISSNRLEDYITFLGKKSISEVRKAMENADIFLMTSDYHEGWGVVINESMNCGCVVIADASAGASRYLINDGENGFVYKNNKIETMFPVIEKLIKDENYRKNIQRKAYYYMVNSASPEIVAKRFLALCAGKTFDEGVCSCAPVVKSNRE